MTGNLESAQMNNLDPNAVALIKTGFDWFSTETTDLIPILRIGSSVDRNSCFYHSSSRSIIPDFQNVQSLCNAIEARKGIPNRTNEDKPDKFLLDNQDLFVRCLRKDLSKRLVLPTIDHTVEKTYLETISEESFKSGETLLKYNDDSLSALQTAKDAMEANATSVNQENLLVAQIRASEAVARYAAYNRSYQAKINAEAALAEAQKESERIIEESKQQLAETRLTSETLIDSVRLSLSNPTQCLSLQDKSAGNKTIQEAQNTLREAIERYNTIVELALNDLYVIRAQAVRLAYEHDIQYSTTLVRIVMWLNTSPPMLKIILLGSTLSPSSVICEPFKEVYSKTYGTRTSSIGRNFGVYALETLMDGTEEEQEHLFNIVTTNGFWRSDGENLAKQEIEKLILQKKALHETPLNPNSLEEYINLARQLNRVTREEFIRTFVDNSTGLYRHLFTKVSSDDRKIFDKPYFTIRDLIVLRRQILVKCEEVMPHNLQGARDAFNAYMDQVDYLTNTTNPEGEPISAIEIQVATLLWDYGTGEEEFRRYANIMTNLPAYVDQYIEQQYHAQHISKTRKMSLKDYKSHFNQNQREQIEAKFISLSQDLLDMREKYIREAHREGNLKVSPRDPLYTPICNILGPYIRMRTAMINAIRYNCLDVRTIRFGKYTHAEIDAIYETAADDVAITQNAFQFLNDSIDPTTGLQFTKEAIQQILVKDPRTNINPEDPLGRLKLIEDVYPMSLPLVSNFFMFGRGIFISTYPGRPNYGLKNIKDVINYDSGHDAGDEDMLPLFPYIFGINLYICQVYDDHINVEYLFSNSITEGRIVETNLSIVIEHNRNEFGGHFETIGTFENGVVNTLFTPQHPFIQALNEYLRIKRTMGGLDVMNQIYQQSRAYTKRLGTIIANIPVLDPRLIR